MASGRVADQVRFGIVKGNDAMRDEEWRRSAPTGEDYAFGHYAIVVAKGQVADIIPALTEDERLGLQS